MGISIIGIGNKIIFYVAYTHHTTRDGGILNLCEWLQFSQGVVRYASLNLNRFKQVRSSYSVHVFSVNSEDWILNIAIKFIAPSSLTPSTKVSRSDHLFPL